MSVQALGWVFDHSPTTGAARLVLLAIANHVHGAAGEWEAWPGVETLQREAGLARKRSVNDALAKLIDMGAITRVVNGAPDGRTRADRRPNLYRILVGDGVTCSDTRCGWCGVTRSAARDDESRHDGVTKNGATGCRETSPEPEGNRNPEPEVQPPLGAELVEPVATFDEFWQIFPRRREKVAAEREWAKAVKRATPDEILAGARRYATEIGDRVQFAKYPARWLRDDRWNDEPDPAAATGREPTQNRDRQSGRIKL